MGTRAIKHHSLFFLMISLILIVPLLTEHQTFNDPGVLMIWVLIGLSYFFLTGIAFKQLLICFVISSIFHLPTLFATLLFPAEPFFLEDALINFYRLMSLSSLSLLSMRQFDYCHLIYFFMKKRILSPIFGHTLILSFNSLYRLANDFNEIRLVAKNRSYKVYQYPVLILPLMVSSIRYAQRASLSLMCRNIHRDKDFYFDYSIKKIDTALFLMYLGIIIFFVGIVNNNFPDMFIAEIPIKRFSGNQYMH
jgi:hypothetical protein